MQDIELVLSISHKLGYEIYPDSDSAILSTGSACGTASDVRWKYPDLKWHCPDFWDVHDKMGENYPGAPPFGAACSTWAELGLQVLWLNGPHSSIYYFYALADLSLDPQN